MVRCVLSLLKPSELLAVENASAFFTAKIIELLGLYPMHSPVVNDVMW